MPDLGPKACIISAWGNAQEPVDSIIRGLKARFIV